MSAEKLGLSHSLPEDAPIVHSTVLGTNCLGRLTDLLSAYCKRELDLEDLFLSDFRLVLQGLLEFSCPKGDEALGQIELGENETMIMVASRFPARIALSSETASKELTQYWLNSEELKTLKRMLGPQDRVEARYHEKMNLIEWRVCRPKLKLAESEVDHSESFKVFVDSSVGLDSANVKYQELGDLPFAEWLSDAYKNKSTSSRAGSIVVEGESQDDQEWARVVVDRERQEIEDEIRKISELEKFAESEFIKISGTTAKEDTTEIEVSSFVPKEEIEQILLKNQDRFEAAKELSRRIRKLEISLDQEKVISQQRLVKVETLLRRKEYSNQRHMTEINELRKAVTESKKRVKEPEKNESNFKLKALEMFEALKKAKEETKEVLRAYDELKNKDMTTPEASLQPGSAKAIDDLSKRLERVQRALDAEKMKVKNLSERVMVAEKEAQFAAPMVEDLESKVEHTLKVAAQHKKETEQVKQKLMQSDAEKNKIKNDLIKANAQIQTLMKRQAA